MAARDFTDITGLDLAFEEVVQKVYFFLLLQSCLAYYQRKKRVVWQGILEFINSFYVCTVTS